MFRKSKKKEHTPVRLAKVEEKPKRVRKYQFSDYLFTFLIVLVIILLLSLCLLICFTFIPQTYGFYWY